MSETTPEPSETTPEPSETTTRPPGTVTAIHVTSVAGRPMVPLEQATAIAGKGLDGDRYATGYGRYSDTPSPGGGREVTLIATEALDEVRREHGLEVALGEARRNLTTEGVDLDALIGRTFRIGVVRCEGVKPCRPCGYLDQVTGKAFERPLRGSGGLRANILVGGTIRLGDTVTIDPQRPPTPS